MKTYISCSVNGLARITPETPDHIVGVGTHGLKTCTAIFICSSTKLSIIHIDAFTSDASILAEFASFQDNFKVTFVINKRFLQQELLDTLEAVYPQVQTSLYKNTNEIVYMNRQGELICDHKKIKDANITYTPQTLFRNAIRCINVFFHSKPGPLSVEFDGKKFCPPAKICSEGMQLLEKIRGDLKPLGLSEHKENILAYIKSLRLNDPALAAKLDQYCNLFADAITTALESMIPVYALNHRPSFFLFNDEDVKICFKDDAKAYAGRLEKVLEDLDGDKEDFATLKFKKKSLTASIDFNNDVASLPIFWLKQLQQPAITELVTNFELDEKQFRTTFP